MFGWTVLLLKVVMLPTLQFFRSITVSAVIKNVIYNQKHSCKIFPLIRKSDLIWMNHLFGYYLNELVKKINSLIGSE